MALTYSASCGLTSPWRQSGVLSTRVSVHSMQPSACSSTKPQGLKLHSAPLIYTVGEEYLRSGILSGSWGGGYSFMIRLSVAAGTVIVP